MDPLQSFHAHGFTINIVPDRDPQNPREWEMAATLAMKNKDWADDDAVSADSEAEFYVRLAQAVGEELYKYIHYEDGEISVWAEPDQHDENIIETARQIAFQNYYITEVYCYQESAGIALSTSGFGSAWDFEQAGFAYIKKAYIKKVEAHAPDSKTEEEWAHDIMASEVETYGQYLNCECFGFVIQSNDGRIVDSGVGFFDLEYCKEEALRVAECATAKS